jgi:hypothetical protein
VQSSLPRRRREQRANDDVRLVPGPPRFTWTTALEKAECRFEHPMVFGIEKVIVLHQAKRHEMVRLFGVCETCGKKRGERTFQVGFYDRREIRWYAIPTEGQYEDAQDWDGRVTEEMTREILRLEWNKP